KFLKNVSFRTRGAHSTHPTNTVKQFVQTTNPLNFLQNRARTTSDSFFSSAGFEQTRHQQRSGIMAKTKPRVKVFSIKS
ncbi:hypothetical protein, partial [Uliginosibacterium flavum]